MHEHTPSIRVITLGTAGGPRLWTDAAGEQRCGIATAIVVDESVYLVDAGQGAARQLKNAGFGIGDVRGLFITHMHSDHTVDLPTLLLFAQFERKDPSLAPIAVYGPGRRGALPPLSPRATAVPHPVAAENPGPGTVDMFDLLTRAYAAEINDRVFDSLTRPPSSHFDVHDIDLPTALDFDPNGDVAPAMEPFVVYRDDLVTVSATLVLHPPTAPAFAFRFDTAAGSVTISGDTAPCANLVRLARDTDLLLHEAIDLDTIAAQYTGSDLQRATMDHHRRAHTTPRQAGLVAAEAGARALALHHLVPAYAPPETWLEAADTFAGPLHVPADLDVITVDARVAEVVR